MRTLIIILLSFALSGCTALLVGGGAAAGYQVGKDERSAGQVTRDAATTSAIKSKLVADSLVSAFNINVDTYADRVTLRGAVSSVAARRRAADIAASVPAVTGVDNRITVSRN